MIQTAYINQINYRLQQIRQMVKITLGSNNFLPKFYREMQTPRFKQKLLTFFLILDFMILIILNNLLAVIFVLAQPILFGIFFLIRKKLHSKLHFNRLRESQSMISEETIQENQDFQDLTNFNDAEDIELTNQQSNNNQQTHQEYQTETDENLQQEQLEQSELQLQIISNFICQFIELHQQNSLPVQQDNTLNDEEINVLPSFVFQSDTEIHEEECVICFLAFEENQLIRTLPCVHNFHSDCVDSWLKIKKECPMCKQNIRLA